jgi:hypothetical protein
LPHIKYPTGCSGNQAKCPRIHTMPHVTALPMPTHSQFTQAVFCGAFSTTRTKFIIQSPLPCFQYHEFSCSPPFW